MRALLTVAPDRTALFPKAEGAKRRVHLPNCDADTRIPVTGILMQERLNWLLRAIQMRSDQLYRWIDEMIAKKDEDNKTASLQTP
jgi:hypothetical protein